MPLSYAPCAGINGNGCASSTWRRSPQLCKRCYRLWKRGAAPNGGAASAPKARRSGPSKSRPFAPKPTPESLAFDALAALEATLIAKAAATGASDEVEKLFARYNKTKALAMAPGTPGEGANALKLSLKTLIEAVQLAF